MYTYIYTYMSSYLTTYLTINWISQSIFRYIYIYIYISCWATRTDLSDSLSRHSSLSSIALLYIGSSWSSYLCSSVWRSPQEHIAYELVLTSPKCPVCLVRVTWIVFVMGGSWPYRCCFVGCCLQDLFTGYWTQWIKALAKSSDITKNSVCSIPGEGSGELLEGKLTGDNW